MRNENFAPYLLQPFPAPPLDEERELCLQISTPARRWNVARAALFRLNWTRNVHPIPLSGVYRERRAVPAAPPGPSLFLSHASCPGYFLPCFPIFALPRRTLKGGSLWLLPIPAPVFFFLFSLPRGTDFFLVQSFGRTCLRRLRRSLPFQRKRKK